jgi:hypothetical protein
MMEAIAAFGTQFAMHQLLHCLEQRAATVPSAHGSQAWARLSKRNRSLQAELSKTNDSLSKLLSEALNSLRHVRLSSTKKTLARPDSPVSRI